MEVLFETHLMLLCSLLQDIKLENIKKQKLPDTYIGYTRPDALDLCGSIFSEQAGFFQNKTITYLYWHVP